MIMKKLIIIAAMLVSGCDVENPRIGPVKIIDVQYVGGGWGSDEKTILVTDDGRRIMFLRHRDTPSLNVPVIIEYRILGQGKRDIIGFHYAQ